MKILILEPSRYKQAELLSLLKTLWAQNVPDAMFVCHWPKDVFTRPMPADTDLAFLTINSMADVEAAKQFKRLHQGIPLVVVSDSKEYAVESYTLPAASYITRPLNTHKIASVLAKVPQKSSGGNRS